MFGSNTQALAAARTLLRSLRLEHLWDGYGPTDKALELLERGGGHLSSGEAIMLRVASDVWNGHGKAEVGRMLATLDNDHLRLVGSLMVAVASGPRAVDRWLAEHQQQQQTSVGAADRTRVDGVGGMGDVHSSDAERPRTQRLALGGDTEAIRRTNTRARGRRR